MYNSKSKSATEFIDDTEIKNTLAYAKDKAVDIAYLNAIMDKAEKRKGITHREALCLLESENIEIKTRIYKLAMDIKQSFYGNRIVMFAPLYLSNYCVNGCKYCPYNCNNKHIARKHLTQEEIVREVNALQDMGHKRLALETGEHPKCDVDYMIDSIKTIYATKHSNGAIRRVNVNIAATTEENYRRLKDAGIGTYILFQETYNRANYENMHPSGPKSDYCYHTEAMDRAMAGGIDDVGIGVLFGLEYYKYDFVGLLMHAEHLEDLHGVGPHTVSVPRIRPADEIDMQNFTNAVPDEVFEKIVAILRISIPYTGLIISTRESKIVREKALRLGVSQISGGSRTSVGGYADGGEDSDSTQFEVNDNRTLEEVVYWLLSLGYVPSFCTACYREGRTGDRFMQLVKTGQIANVCQSNAIMTLAEYLEDYASPQTAVLGYSVIDKEITKIASEKAKAIVIERLNEIKNGKRDFRF